MSTPSISVVFPTVRDDPAFDWFTDSLARQLGDADDVEVIVVDALFDAWRGERFRACADGRYPVVHVAPKPTPYQGPWRRTSHDCFAAANARNTGLVYARAPYVVFADDCALPMPGWWQAVKRAAAHGDVVAGAYQKQWDMRVVRGTLERGRVEPSGVDSRWAHGDVARPVPIDGGCLYGASFGAPRDLLLSVNGLDELCDSTGGEDYQLGLRLTHAGVPILYARSMLTIESEELGRLGKTYARHDRTLPEPAYMARLAEFGLRERSTTGRCDSSHMVLDVTLGTGSWATYGNAFRLADLSPDRFEATVAQFPDRHWFDGCPLRDL
ncbi:MAG: glycosyltransferase [Vicinamibacteria bacterium]